jgi:RNA polymerase sigma-70 factor, ECF subfamily
MATLLRLELETLDDIDLAARVAARDAGAVRLLTQRNNQRLFRAAWSIRKDRAEAEDAVQSAYLRAFAAIGRYEGRSSLSTWLTRIAINEALARRRAARRRQALFDAASVAVIDDYREALMRGSTSGCAPDTDLARAEIRELLERAIADLPTQFRTVFVLRDIEGLGIDETAEILGLLPATVKTRHFRARRRLRQALAPAIETALADSVSFAGADCAAMTDKIVHVFLRRPVSVQ